MSFTIQLGQAWALIDLGGEGPFGVTDFGYGTDTLAWCHNTTPLLAAAVLMVIAFLALSATARRMAQ